MALFGWFQKRKQQEDTIPVPSPFYTMIFDHKLDLLPAARDVHALVDDLAIDAETLAQYAMRYGNGEHIKKQDIPVGVSASFLRQLISRTMRWTTWPYRRDQLQDPDLRKIFSHVELRICDHCQTSVGCKTTMFEFDAIVRLPRDDVPITQACDCYYRTIRKTRPSR